MPSYKLTYFNGVGRGEVSRLLFLLAGQDFQDVRIEPDSEEWNQLKPKTTSGLLPLLEVDGRMFSQSTAIQRYLAREFGFYGKTNLEAIQIDEVVGIVEDVYTAGIKIFWGHGEARVEAIKDIRENTGPMFCASLATLLKQNGTGYFVGSSVTLADLAVYVVIHNTARRLKKEFPEMLDNFPTLLEHAKRIGSMDKIRQHVEKRVETWF